MPKVVSCGFCRRRGQNHEKDHNIVVKNQHFEKIEIGDWIEYVRHTYNQEAKMIRIELNV